MDNTRITKVYLLNVPLESDYKHTLYFNSKSGQHSYFESKVVKSYTTFSYQRKDNIIRIPDNFDDVLKCNYVMYQNTAYSNKWFYAFIKDIKYVNDGRTDVEIETDVIQTWMFDGKDDTTPGYVVKRSFVEREHVDDDTVGLHTYPEQLETGDYITQVIYPTSEYYDDEDTLNFLSKTSYAEPSKLEHYVTVVFGLSEVPNQLGAAPVSTYNGVFGCLQYVAFPSFANARAFINDIQDDYGNDLIVTAFMIPEIMTKNIEMLSIKNSDGSIKYQYMFITPTDYPYELITDATIKKNNFIDGDYPPRNNKLLVYPYKSLVITNNSGSACEYKYEEFKGDKCKFDIKGGIGVGCSIRLIPKNYNEGQSEGNTLYKNYIDGLDAGKLPTCSWTNDSYTNWLTANSVNLGVGIGFDVANMAVGAMMIPTGFASMMGFSMIAGGAQGIGNTIGEVYSHSRIPNTAKGGVNQGDFTFSERITFSFYKKSIKREYAEIIDGYFDMFGYKVCKVKVPNTHHRSRYWYTKTIDVNIDGAIPNKDMQRIKDCYNNGITFWRNANELGDYSLSNEIKNIK